MSRRYITADERREISERARGCCEYCQSQASYATQPYVIEHIVPLSRGGETTLGNLALACGGCNGHKYDKIEAPDPVGGQFAMLFNPRRDEWHEHFGWNDTYTEIIGLTPTGRATVSALHLNRPGLINIRRLLRTVGKHP